MMTNWTDSVEATGRKVSHRVIDNVARTYHKAHMLACGLVTSYDAEQVMHLMDYAASMTGRAKSVLAFKDAIGTLTDAENQLQKAVGDINAKLKKGEHLAADATAACAISAAIEVLRRWDPQGDSADAAKAFDQLFGGVANFMGHLPFPLDQYKGIFEGIGKYGFFSHMRDLLTHGPGTSGDRVLREAEKDTGMTLH
jgi:hypothetical protein